MEQDDNLKLARKKLLELQNGLTKLELERRKNLETNDFINTFLKFTIPIFSIISIISVILTKEILYPIIFMIVYIANGIIEKHNIKKTIKEIENKIKISEKEQLKLKKEFKHQLEKELENDRKQAHDKTPLDDKNKKIIVMNTKMNTTINISLYEFIELCCSCGIPFHIYSVTEEEFLKMEHEIIPYDMKNKELEIPNLEIFSNKDVSYNEDAQSFMKKNIPTGLKIYTKESYEDIATYYQEHNHLKESKEVVKSLK